MSFRALVILALYLCITQLSCARNAPESSQMRIFLPSAGAPSSKIQNAMANSNWGVADPTQITDIMCYAIAVAGPEMALKGKSCKNSADKNVIDAGLIEGLYAAGSEVVLEVPSGSDRIFYLMGFSADSTAACKKMAETGGRPLNSYLSAPYVVAQKKVTLMPGNQSLTMHASLTGALKLEDCDWDGSNPAPTTPNLPNVPVISSVDVFVNGVLYADSPPILVNEGDAITMTVNATDPKALPLEYSFHIFQNCTHTSIHQNFSSTNNMSTYTTTSADVNSCSSITIGVKNNDSEDLDSSLFGDLQYSIPLQVSNGSSSPSVASVEVRVNGVLQGAPPINMNVGDTLDITVNATDPNDLPLEYVFLLYQNCSLASTLQPFSSSSIMSSYVATASDVNGCNSIGIGVKNNDGTDLDGSLYGDLQHSIQLNVSDGTAPPTIDSVNVYINGFLQSHPVTVVVGDVVTMSVQATDPNDLPLEYVFLLYRNCSLATTLQNFSPMNTFDSGYTFTPSDITACTQITVGVKNDDGVDFDSPLLGDVQYPAMFTVNP